MAMYRSYRPLLVDIAILALIVAGLAYIIHQNPRIAPFNTAKSAATSTQPAAAAVATSSATVNSASTTATTTVKKSSSRATESTSAANAPAAPHVEHPYATPPESFDIINPVTREALVNIYCLPRGGGLKPISGSGTIIDPRGIVLTNAHVAQYVLLSEDPRVDLACFLRTGSPAGIRWTPSVLYIPPVWVSEHAADIKVARPMGTGEHDYALLYITGAANGAPLPASFPHIAPDTRSGVGLVADQVLVASYPAEFLGNIATNLYAAASVSSIRELFTFSTTSIDAFSVGGVIEAQSGSSGGAIVNAWRRLIGVITTTSSGATTAERDLRAISLNYVDRDLRAQTGHSLADILAGDPMDETRDFTENAAPKLIEQLMAQLSR